MRVFLLVSVLVGFLYIGPPLAIWGHFREQGNEFVLAQYKTYRDSLQAYLPRAREIYDGHFPPAELYGSESSAPTVQNPLPSLFFAGFLYLFRGDVNSAYLGAQFFFSTAIFLLFAFLGWLMWRSKLWAAFFGLVATLTPIPLKLPFYKWQGLSEFQAFFINNFIPFVRTQFDQLYLARVDEPLLTYSVYLAAFAALVMFWQKPSARRAVCAGVVAGLLFYTYFHHWVYWAVALGSLFILTLVFYRGNRGLVKNFLLLWACLAAVAIPYFVTYFRFSALPGAEDFTLRAGVTFGRAIGVGRENAADLSVYLILAAGTYFLYWRKSREKAVLFFGLIAAMFIVWNIQLVVGYAPVPHFFRRSISPIMFIVLFNFIYDIFSRIKFGDDPFLKRAGIAVLAVLSIALTAKKAVNVLEIRKNLQPHLADYYVFPNEVAQSWRWINENLEREPRIVSPSTLTSFYLTSYTSARPLLPTAFITLLPISEMEDRYLISHKLFGVTREVLLGRLEGKIPLGCSGYGCAPDLSSNLNDSFWNLYGNYFASRYGEFKKFIARAEQPRIKEARVGKINELLQRYDGVPANWSKIEADYVYYGPLERQIVAVDLSKDKNLHLVYDNLSVAIYKISH